MKLIRKSKNIISKVLPVSVLVFFAFSYVALASEINRDSIIQMVNQSRTENNVEILSENQTLNKVAEDKLNDMISNSYFAHTSPSGIAPWHWFDENKYDYKYAGENLAMGFSSVENEHQAWMDSPTHKKNILNENYKEIGVAVGKGTIDGSLVTIAVQEFGTKTIDASGIKEENNLPDDKAKDLIKESKEEKKGIVLNTENQDNNNPDSRFLSDRDAEPKISFSKFKDALFNDRNFLRSSIVATMLTILAICIAINLSAVMFLAVHVLVIHLRKNQDIFKVVHGLLILFLIGSFVF